MSEEAEEIPLEQVASVFAAEQEGFELGEVLAVEGIAGDAWEKARTDSLVKVATDVDAHERYTEALHAAQDRLHCDIAPVYEDLGAWVAFVKATDGGGFTALAATYALVPNDLCRLERHWRQRLVGGSALSKQTRAIRDDPPALPPLVVGQRTLVPSPYAAAGDDSEQTAPPAQSADDATDGSELLHRMATLYAVLCTNVSLEAAYARFEFESVDAAKQAIEAWDARVKGDRQLDVDFRALVAHYRRRRELLVSSVRHPVAAPVRGSAKPLPDIDIDETAKLEPGFLPLEALPFADATSVPDTAGTTTFLKAFVFDGPVLPFSDGRSAEDDLDATCAVIPGMRFSAPTPFEGRAEDNGGVSLVAPTEVDVPDVNATSLIKAIRFETLPFGTDRRTDEERKVTGLTLEQYASYCVELMLYPDKQDPIRARYRIQDEAEHDKMHKKWNNAMSASSATRARFQEIYGAYRAHLRDHPITW